LIYLDVRRSRVIRRHVYFVRRNLDVRFIEHVSKEPYMFTEKRLFIGLAIRDVRARRTRSTRYQISFATPLLKFKVIREGGGGVTSAILRRELDTYVRERISRFV